MEREDQEREGERNEEGDRRTILVLLSTKWSRIERAKCEGETEEERMR